jgi:hypothetical protein
MHELYTPRPTKRLTDVPGRHRKGRKEDRTLHHAAALQLPQCSRLSRDDLRWLLPRLAVVHTEPYEAPRRMP